MIVLGHRKKPRIAIILVMAIGFLLPAFTRPAAGHNRKVPETACAAIKAAKYNHWRVSTPESRLSRDFWRPPVNPVIFNDLFFDIEEDWEIYLTINPIFDAVTGMTAPLKICRRAPSRLIQKKPEFYLQHNTLRL